MAKAEISVIQVLRDAAKLLERTDCYQWGHMGKCNCGFLTQVVTGLKAADIHRTAMSGYGDWSEQLNDYCPSTGKDMDCLITELLAAGFEREDLAHLERLSDPEIVPLIPYSLRHNQKEDVVAYLRTWAAQLEDKWLSTQPLPEWSPLTDEQEATETQYSLSPRFPG